MEEREKKGNSVELLGRKLQRLWGERREPVKE